MFKFFRRSSPATSPAATRPEPKSIQSNPSQRKPQSAQGRAAMPAEAALPQVVEGNDNSDWALWEDSVMVLDSQMQGLTPSARIYDRTQEKPSEYQDIDPFAKVGKKSA